VKEKEKMGFFFVVSFCVFVIKNIQKRKSYFFSSWEVCWRYQNESGSGIGGIFGVLCRSLVHTHFFFGEFCCLGKSELVSSFC